MSQSTIIAHISDVHITPLSGLSARYLNVKRTLGLVNWHRERKHVYCAEVADLLLADMLTFRPDNIAVTGDLCNIGLPSEYTAALNWLKRVGTPDDVTVVPGNHDIYTRIGSHPGVTLWRDYMVSDAFGAKLPGVGVTPRGFPFVRRVGAVALIGVNSAVETGPFVAAGRVGPEQLAALEVVLGALRESGLARIVLIHHPPLPGLAPKARELMICCLFGASSSRPMQGVPLSSATVRSSTTENSRRSHFGSASRRAWTLSMSSAFRRGVPR